MRNLLMYLLRIVLHSAAVRYCCQILAMTALSSAGVAKAAPVDLVVNVVSAKASYTATELETYTVSIVNRGTATASNSTFSLNIPSTASSGVAWNTGVTCVATGGAICPSSYVLPLGATTLSGTVPSLPVNGKLTLTVPAQGSSASFVSGSMNVVATVAPGPADTDTSSNTDTSNIFVYIAPPQLSYGTTVTGSATLAAPGGMQATYTVVLQNKSTDTNDIVSSLVLAVAKGTGSVSSLGYLPGTKFNSITCAGATGGASCANVVATSNAPEDPIVISPQPVPLVNTSNNNNNLMQRVGATQMPGGSTLTLTVVVDVGTAACSTSGTADNRELTLTSSVGPIWPSGNTENPDSPGDNTAVQSTLVGAQQCRVGDLVLRSITQDAAQTVSGVGPNAPFSYKVTYSNDSGATANNVPLEFRLIWPTTPASLNNASCVSSGGAQCPSSYNIAGSNSFATSPSIPFGGILEITYSGVSGGDSTQVCKPLYAIAQASIAPPSNFLDTNYNQTNPLYQTGVNRMGNNSFQVITQANIGVACTPSFDAVSTKSGPYLDLAGTIPAPMPLQPGQYVYFKISFENAVPGLPFNDYKLSDGALGLTWNTAYNSTGSSENRIEMVAKPGDPVGLSTPPGYALSTFTPPLSIDQFDMGVHCTASGGAVCPDYVEPAASGGGGGGYWHTKGWQAYWPEGTKPQFPVGGRLDFVSTFRVPPLKPNLAAGGCYQGGQSLIGSNKADIGSVKVDPLGSDRTAANNSMAVPLTVLLPACTQTLAISKSIASPTVPATGLIDYTIVVTNTSANNLDLPRLIDLASDLQDPIMTLTCQSTSGGALCPDFTPQQGVKVLADGSTRSMDATDSIFTKKPAFDFVWGAVGEATMPPNSSVTFHVTEQYPLGQIPSLNSAFFSGSEQSAKPYWPTVTSSAGPTVAEASALSITKAVSPVQALPGQQVSYSVDAVNYAADATNVAFKDDMSSAMSSANPAGFANLTCRPLTAADNVFPAGTPIVAATCPSFNSASSGITATIPDFPANSGLRLTYTAIAPASAISVPNIAQLQHVAGVVTQGDASSQANYLVLAGVQISGNVFNDVNGSRVKDGGEQSVPLPTGLQAVITDANGVVVATVAIDANGNFSAPVAANGSYTVTVTPPAGWVVTGENLAGAPDGLADSKQTVTVGTIDRPNVNFGMEQPPVAGSALYSSQSNPSGTSTVPVDAAAFIGNLPAGVTGSNASDPAPGAVTKIAIPRFPSNTASITINGVIYTAANFPAAGIVVTVAQLSGMALDPQDGSVAVVIPYTAIDAAGKVSGEGSVTLPFVSGPDVSTTTAAVNNNNGTATFTVVTSNAPGTATASNTVSTLQLPAGMTGVVVSGGGVYDPATGLVTWPPITLAPGSSNPAAQTVTIPYTSGATVTGNANVTTTGEASTLLANNPSSASVKSGEAMPSVPVPALGEWGVGGLMLLILVGLIGRRQQYMRRQ